MSWTKLGAVLLALGMLTVATPDAQAWTKAHNSTANTVFVAYAFNASAGFLCGYNDPCSNGWRIIAWHAIAPGGDVTVNNNPHHNARHQFFATDNVGHTWQGGGSTFRILHPSTPRQNFTVCSDTSPWQWNSFAFVNKSNSTCCGANCSPVNHTAINFTL